MQGRLPYYTKAGKLEIYHLYISDTTVNYTGKRRPAMAINGTIPGPVLNFTEGDTAVIYVHNLMGMETSIHWHGLILPNRYDGVSYLTTSPIKAGDVHVFKFALVQHGTYWYHAHTMTQQQSGLYGALIIRKPDQPRINEHTVLLSDWTDENPDQVERLLHNATDWYSIRKGSTQNYLEALKTGNLKTKINNELKRMTAMDVSDVSYDRVFNNGKITDSLPDYLPGQKLRLHIINGSSSSYLWLQFAGGKITVVANDGEDVEPVKVDRLIVGVAETYDIEITLPGKGAYEFTATTEDRTRYNSLWIGSGIRHTAFRLPRLRYFKGMQMMNNMMGSNGDLKPMPGMPMSNQAMDMNTVMYPEISGNQQTMGKMPMNGDELDMDTGATMDKGTGRDSAGTHDIVTLNYTMLRATHKTTLPPGPIREFKFDLTGNMNRYVWTINNKTVSEAGKILIRQGENVRIILYNNTMMRHPMHLHGHYFRLLNGQGAYSPLKNTLDIMPMERDTLEFQATASGDWFFHCHILYHMMAGMGRIFSYENSPADPEIPDTANAIKKVYADDLRFYNKATIGLESDGSKGEFITANTRWQFAGNWNIGLTDRKGQESETTFGRFLGQMQWLYAYAGFDYHYKKTSVKENNLFGQLSDKNDLHTFVAGLDYTLPMLFVADARIDGNGKIRFQLGREDIPLTARLRFSLAGNTDIEYSAGLRYIVTRSVSLSSHYDSDTGFGAGLSIAY